MHNNIMAAGSRDRPPMLATGRYAQWRSRAQYESKRSDSLILTGIGDEIRPTVGAYVRQTYFEFGQFTSHDGETIESYYTRFYKMMNEMIRNNLTVATMQVNVQFLQQLQPEWSRFVTIVKQQHKLDEVSYHKLFDILKQYQKEVNELRAERMAKNANPLALVSQLASRLLNTSRPIAKPITPPSESASEEDSDPEQAQKDKDMQKNLALIAKYFKKLYKLTYSTTTSELPQNTKQECGYYTRCSKLQARANLDWLATRMKRLMNKNLEARYNNMAKIQEVPNADSGTDAEPLEQVQYDTDDNVFANDIQHFDQSESISNTCAVETGDSNVTSDSPDMCDNDIQDDQNDVECDDEPCLHFAKFNCLI
ncbi:hypothetical protein Tco_0417732 [Tanacetum coccineum]